MKVSTKFLFDLGKVNLSCIKDLLKERNVIANVKIYNSTVELIPLKTCRVANEVWHKGECIFKTIPLLIDLLTEEND